MKKKSGVLILVMLIMLMLSSCSGNNTENTQGDVAGDEKQSEANDNLMELNQEIVDNDNFRAKLVSIEKIEDDIWGNSIEVKFELENKMDKTIEVQAREVSVDGKMVDDSMLSMSQEISPGKTADGILTMTELEGTQLPLLEDSMEMNLHVFSWDDYDLEEDYPVNISFK